jgi:hypothetical protein
MAGTSRITILAIWSSISRRIDSTVLNALIAQGDALLAIGGLAAARLLFERAAVAGNARAAFTAAETYDPIAP